MIRSRQAGRGALAAIVVVALFGLIGYTAFSGLAFSSELRAGRDRLVAAQSELDSGFRRGDPTLVARAASDFTAAERAFDSARQRAEHDGALRPLASVPVASTQVQAAVRLADIGTDMSRAGEAAAQIALEVVRLKQTYTGRSLGADDLAALLVRGSQLAKEYGSTSRAIGDQLQAAHGARSEVVAQDLMPPLREAFDEVDAALARADQAFTRYRDVRQVVSDLLETPVGG